MAFDFQSVNFFVQFTTSSLEQTNAHLMQMLGRDRDLDKFFFFIDATALASGSILIFVLSHIESVDALHNQVVTKSP